MSADPPTVGVVIAAFQAERYLAATLDSVSALTFTAWECVIVDDGSTDRTAAIADDRARADPRFRVFHQRNAGVGAARNRGLAALSAETTLVNFLDSDDLLLPKAFDWLVDALADRPDAVGSSGWAELIDAEGKPIDPGAHRRNQLTRRIYRRMRAEELGPTEDSSFASLAVHGTIWPPATAVLRRSAVERVGGFDTTLVSQEDWDLTLRLARLGPLVSVDEQVAWYRRHGGNASRDWVRYLRDSAMVRRKTWRDPDNTPAHSVAILRSDVRVHAWMLLRQAQLVLRERAEGRWSAVLCGLLWSLYAVAQLALITPRVPPERLLRRLTELEVRTRSGPGHPSYLQSY